MQYRYAGYVWVMVACCSKAEKELHFQVKRFRQFGVFRSIIMTGHFNNQFVSA